MSDEEMEEEQFALFKTQNFGSTIQPVHTTQQCLYMGAWASQATVPFI